ncbi:MAG: hypothetical protein H8D43_01235 [Chloroflexi bacterium]|nr:hypothetical protein [Chloroflexota bacterium]
MAVNHKQSTQELAKEWDKVDISRLEVVRHADELRQRDDILEALELYAHAIDLSEEDYERGIAEVGLGICYLLQEDPDGSKLQKARENLTSAANSLRGRDPLVEGVTLLLLGVAHQAQGTSESFSEALKVTTRALKMLEEEGETLARKARKRVREIGSLIAEKSEEEITPPVPPDQPPPFTPPQLVRIPILGEIAAGPLMLAEEHIEGYIPMREDRARGIDFALRVKGNSMAGASIKDGDVVFIRSQAHADKGDVVVAMVLDQMAEFALKRFYYDDNCIYLWSEPSEGQREEYLSVDKKDAVKVQIQGKVVMI